MIDYKLIRALHRNPGHTQRSLAEDLDVSLGKVNYLLSGLVDKGIIRIKRLKNHPDKIRWRYLLTPKGMREKAKITRNYLKARMKEFDTLKKEIRELKKEVERNGETKNKP